mgnify:CR=1 FL=1
MDLENIDILQSILQIIVAVTILNVWLLRFNKSTPWRGGNASSMKEEFKTYSLPENMMYVLGGLKVLFALGLIIGIAYPTFISISCIGIIVLMAGAIGMHIKVKDEAKKSLPAFIMLILSLAILVLQN